MCGIKIQPAPSMLSGVRYDKFDAWMVFLVLLSYMLVFFLPIKPNKFGDNFFHQPAKIIAQVLHGARDWRDFNVSHAPGPVLYYAIPYSLLPASSTDDSYWIAGLFWTIALVCMSVLLIRRAAAYMVDDLSGRLTAIIMLLTPFPVYYSFGVLAEPMAFVGSTLACYGWARWRFVPYDCKILKADVNLILLGFGLLILILARLNAILLLLIGAFATIKLFTKVERRHEAKPLLYTVILTGVASIGCLLFISLYSHGRQSNQLFYIIFQGRFQYRIEPWDWRLWEGWARVGSADYEMFTREEAALKARSEQEAIPLIQLKKEWAVRDILKYPVITLQQAAVRFLSLHLFIANSKPADDFRFSFIPGRVIFALFHIVVNGVYIFILLMCLCFLFMKRRNISSYWVLWGVYAALLIFHVVTYAEPRYLFPSLPGLTIMAGITLTTFVRRAGVFLPCYRTKTSNLNL